MVSECFGASVHEITAPRADYAQILAECIANHLDHALHQKGESHHILQPTALVVDRDGNPLIYIVTIPTIGTSFALTGRQIDLGEIADDSETRLDALPCFFSLPRDRIYLVGLNILIQGSHLCRWRLGTFIPPLEEESLVITEDQRIQSPGGSTVIHNGIITPTWFFPFDEGTLSKSVSPASHTPILTGITERYLRTKCPGARFHVIENVRSS